MVCLVKCDEHVFATQVVSTVANSKDPDMKIQVPGVIVLNDIYSDFTVTFEVHCLQAQEERLPHHVKYHINKKVCLNFLMYQQLKAFFFKLGNEQVDAEKEQTRM